MAIRLLVIDLDGTLLDSDHRVSSRNRQAVEEAGRAGVEVVVATGRAWPEAHEQIGELPGLTHAITVGGAALHNAATGAVEDAVHMDEEVVAGCVAELLAAGQLAQVLLDSSVASDEYLIIGEGPLDPASRWWFGLHPVRRRALTCFSQWRQRGLVRHALRVGAVADEGAIGPIAGRIAARVGQGAELRHWPAVTATEAIGSSTHMLEIFAPGVDKWTMVQRLARQRGIDCSEIAAIGDGLNDLELIRKAGVSFAMANADPRIAAIATHRVGHHNQSGVAEAIGRLLQCTGAWSTS